MSVRVSVRTSLGGVALPSISKCRAERAQIHLRRRRREHTSVLQRSSSFFSPSAPKLSENKTALRGEISAREEEPKTGKQLKGAPVEETERECR